MYTVTHTYIYISNIFYLFPIGNVLEKVSSKTCFCYSHQNLWRKPDGSTHGTQVSAGGIVDGRNPAITSWGW